jgi:hypothetical protein
MAISYVSEKTRYFNVVQAFCSSYIATRRRARRKGASAHAFGGEPPSFAAHSEAQKGAVRGVDPDRPRGQRIRNGYRPALQDGLHSGHIQNDRLQIGQEQVDGTQLVETFNLRECLEAIECNGFRDVQAAYGRPA